MWFRNYDNEIDLLKVEIEQLKMLLENREENDKQLSRAMDALSKSQMPNDYGARIAELEVKIAKLWGLLVKVNSRGEDALTKHGKRFGGAAFRDTRP